MKAPKRILLALVFLGLTLCAAFSYFTSWSYLCPSLKSNIGNDPDLYTTFEPTPTIFQEEKYWLFSWNSFEIPIPNHAVESVFIYPNNQTFDFFFLFEKGFYLHFSVRENHYQKDIFSYGFIGTAQQNTSLIGEVITSKIFGGPVRYSDLAILEYDSTPNDITCSDKNQNLEAGKLIALTLKNISHAGRLVSVYRGVGDQEGWIEKLINGDREKYSVNVLKDDQAIYNIEYQFPHSSKDSGLPFKIGTKPLSTTIAQPQWANALSLALKLDTEMEWQRFLSEAKMAGFSQKSIENLTKYAFTSRKP